MRIDGMNRNKILGFAVLASLLLNGCGVELDSPRHPISDNAVCVEWGASQEDVTNIMVGYEEICRDNDFICFRGQGGVGTISYGFQNDELCTSAVIISREKSSVSEMNFLFREYTHIGESRGFDVYAQKASNTIAVCSTGTNDDVDYYLVGYSIMKAEDEK